MDAPRAIWNPARDVWETESIDLFSEHSDVYSETWPASGMTRGGLAYELPTPALHTDDSAFSYSRPRVFDTPDTMPEMPNTGSNRRSQPAGLGNQVRALLKTPTSQLAVNGGSQHPDKRRAGGHGPTLADEVEHLFPTPAAMNPNDGEGLETWQARRERVKAKGINGNGFGTPLSIAVQLLPTPSTADRLGGHERRGGQRGEELLLNGVAKEYARGGLTPLLSSDGSESAADSLPPPLVPMDGLEQSA